MQQTTQSLDNKEVNHLILKSIFVGLYQNTPSTPEQMQLNNKIENQYSSLTGLDFPSAPDSAQQQMLCLYTKGVEQLDMFEMNAQELTQIYNFLVASRAAAQMLGLNFVLNPSEDYEAKKEDFVFHSIYNHVEGPDATSAIENPLIDRIIQNLTLAQGIFVIEQEGKLTQATKDYTILTVQSFLDAGISPSLMAISSELQSSAKLNEESTSYLSSIVPLNHVQVPLQYFDTLKLSKYRDNVKKDDLKIK